MKNQDKVFSKCGIESFDNFYLIWIFLMYSPNNDLYILMNISIWPEDAFNSYLFRNRAIYISIFADASVTQDALLSNHINIEPKIYSLEENFFFFSCHSNSSEIAFDILRNQKIERLFWRCDETLNVDMDHCDLRFLTRLFLFRCTLA